jgi:beta-lactamase regulating signal transducer with metallopeptidase domain
MILDGSSGLLTLVLEFTLKSFFLVAVILAITWTMRRSSAAERHLYLSIAVIVLLLLPLTALIIPSWNVGFLTNPFPETNKVTHFSTGSARTEVPPSDIAGDPASKGQPGTGLSESSRLGSGPGSRSFRWMLLIWGAGAGILLIRLLGGKMYGSWIAWQAPAGEDERIRDAVERVTGRLEIDGNIPILRSDHLQVPFVAGLFRPKLILPSQVENWSGERIEAILYHEFAHIKRKDILIQFLAQLTCCLYWLNPLIWIMERKIFIERERACDDIALIRGVKASEYAEHLMDAMEDLGERKAYVWVMSAMAEGTDFKDRIISVLDPIAKRTTPRLSHLAAAIVLSIILLLPLASLYPWSNGNSVAAFEAAGVAPSEKALPERGKQSDEKTLSEGESPDGQTSALVTLLESPDPKVREHAATALGKSRDPRAVPALVNRLNDTDAKVREHVAAALGNIGDERAISALAKIIATDSSSRVREHAASAIGHIGGNDAYDALVNVYNSDDEVGVRAHAAYGLGLSKDRRAFDLLLDGLNSRHAEIRSHCAEALGLLGDRRAEQEIRKLLRDDPSPKVWEAANRALKMLEGKR